jgi:predicted aspartyl protease
VDVRYGIAVTIFVTFTIGCIDASEFERSSKRILLDKQGGTIEIRTTHPDDKETRDVVRQRLQEEARNGIAFDSPAVQQHKKEILYRYENTPFGGRIRITARSREALVAIQDFLRSQMSNSARGWTVGFDYVANTSLVVVPVMINDHGPYKFLLDTGANKTVLSAAVADKLGIPKGRIEMLLSPGGNVPVTARTLKTLELGAARLENVEIAVGKLGLMRTLNVDGMLGSDYLRRFKISIDYDNQIVDIEPCCPEPVSMVVT